MWFPIVGWAIGGFLQYGRIGRAQADVSDQLKLREHFPTEAWRLVGVEPADAEKVARPVAARLALPNHHFLPSDPLFLLLLDEEGMGFFEAEFALLQELGVDLRLESLPLEVTFQDFVACVCGYLRARSLCQNSQ